MCVRGGGGGGGRGWKGVKGGVADVVLSRTILRVGIVRAVHLAR